MHSKRAQVNFLAFILFWCLKAAWTAGYLHFSAETCMGYHPCCPVACLTVLVTVAVCALFMRLDTRDTIDSTMAKTY